MGDAWGDYWRWTLSFRLHASLTILLQSISQLPTSCRQDILGITRCQAFPDFEGPSTKLFAFLVKMGYLKSELVMERISRRKVLDFMSRYIERDYPFCYRFEVVTKVPDLYMLLPVGL